MTEPLPAKLSSFEQTRLRNFEHTIDLALKTAQGAFMSIGTTLTKIRDEQLYREKHETFSDYCQRRWHFSSRRAYQLIDAVKVVMTLPPEYELTNEAQARELAKVPAEDRGSLLQKLRQRPVTAKAISDGLAQEHELDATGTVIPPDLLAEWHRAADFAEQLDRLNEVKRCVESALRDEDKLFAEISNTVIADLLNVLATLRCVLPYAICPQCVGHKPERCENGLCRGRGFISKFSWDTHVAKEIKDLRHAGK